MAAQAPRRRRQPGGSRRPAVHLHTTAAEPMAQRAPQMRSSDCTRSSSGGSRPRPCCRRPTPPRCCSGHCSPLARSTCARSMAGRRSPQSSSISQLTSPPETIPSCYRRSRHRIPTAFRTAPNCDFALYAERSRRISNSPWRLGWSPSWTMPVRVSLRESGLPGFSQQNSQACTNFNSMIDCGSRMLSYQFHEG
jgi:hypothetical protein